MKAIVRFRTGHRGLSGEIIISPEGSAPASFSIDLVDNTIGYVTTKKLVFFEATVKSVVGREVASAASHKAMAEGNLWI